jgi:hypothetical protein
MQRLLSLLLGPLHLLFHVLREPSMAALNLSPIERVLR